MFLIAIYLLLFFDREDPPAVQGITLMSRPSFKNCCISSWNVFSSFILDVAFCHNFLTFPDVSFPVIFFISCHFLCYILLYFAMYTLLFFAILCYTLLYLVILCYTLLYSVILCLEVSPSKERCAMCEFLGQLSSSYVVNLMIF